MSQVIYLLNAFEHAAQSKAPFRYGYGEKRKAVLEYVDSLEAELATLKQRDAVVDKLAEALRVCCGDRCNAEYNPCAAREALAEYDKLKEGK